MPMPAGQQLITMAAKGIRAEGGWQNNTDEAMTSALSRSPPALLGALAAAA